MISELFTLIIRNTQQESHITRDIKKYLEPKNIKTKDKTILIFLICFLKGDQYLKINIINLILKI